MKSARKNKEKGVDKEIRKNWKYLMKLNDKRKCARRKLKNNKLLKVVDFRGEKFQIIKKYKIHGKQRIAYLVQQRF